MTPCEICQTPGVTKATVVGAFPIQLCAPCGREFVAWLLKQDEHTRLAEIELKISDSRCNAPHTGNADNLSYVNEIQTLRIELMDAASACIGDRRAVAAEGWSNGT